MSESEETATGRLVWGNSIEHLLAKSCDQAKSFEWMHTEAFSYYDKRARILAISSNILTAISGLSNVIAGGEVINGFKLSWLFGGLSILVSISNMLQEKLAYNVLATEHRNYSIQWGIIRRKIEEELCIPRESRKDCKSFMKNMRQDINQVSVDGNAMIPEFIRQHCFLKFNKIDNFDLPDICGQIEHTQVYLTEIAKPLLHIHPNTESPRATDSA